LTAEALNSAGKTRAILNLFQQNKRAEIRSRPRLMVKSGQQATIDVGTEVATKGAIVTTGNTASQSINSAKTGVRLAVKPVVHASGHVDIDIDQSLSEASEAAFSDINSPDIYNRQIKTIVTLQDGGSILLGGLISDKADKADLGVPWVSKIPILGNLFKSKSRGSVRTELMVMIIPYVVDNPAEGQAITKTIQDAFQQQE
jgi:general secretion pathway protein D